MKKIAAAVLAMACLSGAQATLLTTTDSFGLAVTNWNHNLGASQFSSALGTLNSAQFTLTYDIEQRFRAENIGASADVLTPLAQATFLFRKLVGLTQSTLQSTTLNGSSAGFAATAWDGTNDYAGTSGHDFGIVAINGGITFTLAGAALADLIGTGTLGDAGYNVRAVGEGNMDSGNGNLVKSIATTARYNLSVVYDYTAPNTVPEPGSLALVGLALVGAAAIRRKAVKA